MHRLWPIRLPDQVQLPKPDPRKFPDQTLQPHQPYLVQRVSRERSFRCTWQGPTGACRAHPGQILGPCLEGRSLSDATTSEGVLGPLCRLKQGKREPAVFAHLPCTLSPHCSARDPVARSCPRLLPHFASFPSVGPCGHSVPRLCPALSTLWGGCCPGNPHPTPFHRAASVHPLGTGIKTLPSCSAGVSLPLPFAYFLCSTYHDLETFSYLVSVSAN